MLGGGFWPAELKRAGFDAIVIRGQSPKPVYLWLHDGEAELRDASHIWGMVTGDAEQTLREELGDRKVEVLQIGPGGENLVRFAAVMNMSNRAAGRTGMGAVMGSKKLKAIAVRHRSSSHLRSEALAPAGPLGRRARGQHGRHRSAWDRLRRARPAGVWRSAPATGQRRLRALREPQRRDHVKTILRKGHLLRLPSHKRVVETEVAGTWTHYGRPSMRQWRHKLLRYWRPLCRVQG